MRDAERMERLALQWWRRLTPAEQLVDETIEHVRREWSKRDGQVYRLERAWWSPVLHYDVPRCLRVVEPVDFDLMSVIGEPVCPASTNVKFHNVEMHAWAHADRRLLFVAGLCAPFMTIYWGRVDDRHLTITEILTRWFDVGALVSRCVYDGLVALCGGIPT